MDAEPAEGVFGAFVLAEFEQHAQRMRARSRARRDAVRLRSVVDDAATDTTVLDPRATFGVRQPSDRWAGCTNLRTLRSLLSIVDELGFERWRCGVRHRNFHRPPTSHPTKHLPSPSAPSSHHTLLTSWSFLVYPEMTRK